MEAIEVLEQVRVKKEQNFWVKSILFGPAVKPSDPQMGLSHIDDIGNPFGFQAAEIGQSLLTASNSYYRQCLDGLQVMGE